MNAVIANLAKVGLRVTVEGSGEGYTFTSQEPFLFIFGAASEGLTPFESLLAGKAVGDRVHLTAEQHELPGIMGHLFRPLIHFAGLQIAPVTISFTLEVVSVGKPEPKEVVQAIAGASGSSCGGGCGCGCH